MTKLNIWNKIRNIFISIKKDGIVKNNNKFIITGEVSPTNTSRKKMGFRITKEIKIDPPSKFKVTAKSRSQVCPRCKSKKSAERRTNGRLYCKVCNYDMGK